MLTQWLNTKYLPSLTDKTNTKLECENCWFHLLEQIHSQMVRLNQMKNIFTNMKKFSENCTSLFQNIWYQLKCRTFHRRIYFKNYKIHNFNLLIQLFYLFQEEGTQKWNHLHFPLFFVFLIFNIFVIQLNYHFVYIFGSLCKLLC